MQNSAGFVRKRVLAAIAIASIAATWVLYISSTWDGQAKKQLYERTINNVFANMTIDASLDYVYDDINGDLIADAPAEVGLLAKPNQLVFSFIASEDSANDESVWEALTTAISKRTSLPVSYLKLDSSKSQLAALRSGQLHITAFSSGTVPAAVNRAGFVPLWTIGTTADEEGAPVFGYTMQFVVKSESSIKNLQDLRRQKIAFVRPRSNSGCKAAMLQLLQECNSLPERDYDWYFSYSHSKSIQDVLSGNANAAPIASDILERLVAKGELAESSYRVIYESERFPPVAFGCAHNLPGNIQNFIQEVFAGFDWSGTKLEEEMGVGLTKKFLPIVYKDDWANIRRINQAVADVSRTLQ